MINFTLHPQLKKDCHKLFEDESIIYLLNKNALIPWLILVPKTSIKELHFLTDNKYKKFYQQVKLCSNWWQEEFQAEKLNTGSIGNLVPQIHFHIIARYKNDYCWPQPVWGNLQKDAPYNNKLIDELTKKITLLINT